MVNIVEQGERIQRWAACSMKLEGRTVNMRSEQKWRPWGSYPSGYLERTFQAWRMATAFLNLGMYLVCSRNSKEAGVVGVKWIRERGTGAVVREVLREPVDRASWSTTVTLAFIVSEVESCCRALGAWFSWFKMTCCVKNKTVRGPRIEAARLAGRLW